MRPALALALAVALALAACASAPAAPPVTGVTAGLDSAAVARTAPRQPMHVVFAWSLSEGQNRFSGQGVARVEPPYRARLDLFGPRGESYLSAVLDGRQLTLPPGVENAPLPPPTLLWSALGVFLPPEAGSLVGAAEDAAGALRLEYTDESGRWRFVIGANRVESAEHDRPRLGRETVEVRGVAALGLPETATYRDWTAFRELVLRVEQARNVDTFPSDIWSLPR